MELVFYGLFRVYGRLRGANNITIVATAIAMITPMVAKIRYLSAIDVGVGVGSEVVVCPSPTAALMQRMFGPLRRG